MSEERLAAIRERASNRYRAYGGKAQSVDDVLALLAALDLARTSRDTMRAQRNFAEDEREEIIAVFTGIYSLLTIRQRA